MITTPPAAGLDALAAEFEKMGYTVDLSRRELGILVIPSFSVEVGRHTGMRVDVGVPAADYPFSAPACIHVRPGLPYSGPNNIVASALGPDWQYWSRRLSEWSADRSARHIISYINRIFLDA